MEESEVGIRGANSTLRREVYGSAFTTLQFYNVGALCGGSSYGYDGKGLEFKGVFTFTAPDFFNEENFMRELVRVDLQGGKRFIRWFFLQHCNSTMWTLCVEAHSTVYDVEGLEFKRVFISTALDFFSRKNFV